MVEISRAAPITRASFDAQTGRLLIEGPGWWGIGTLVEWEERLRELRHVLIRQRLASYEGPDWPAPPVLPPEF